MKTPNGSIFYNTDLNIINYDECDCPEVNKVSVVNEDEKVKEVNKMNVVKDEDAKTVVKEDKDVKKVNKFNVLNEGKGVKKNIVANEVKKPDSPKIQSPITKDAPPIINSQVH